MSWRLFVVYGLTLGLLSATAYAQSAAKIEVPSIQTIEKQIRVVEANQDLAANLRENILDYLRDAIERLEIAQEHHEKAVRLERSLAQVKAMLRTTEIRLEQSPTTANPAIAQVTDLNELERMVELRAKQLDDSQDGLRKRVGALEAELALWRTRPEELVSELAEVEDRLIEINDEILALPNAGEPRELMQAHQAFLLSRRVRAEDERRALHAEAAWFQSVAAADLVQAQRELATRELALKIAELNLLQDELAKRRGNQADQRVQQAEELVAKTTPELKPVAQGNLEFAQERHDVTDKIQALEQRHERATNSWMELEKEFERTQSMVRDVGLTDSIGLLLRQQRAKLLNPRGLRSSLLHRNDVVREARMRLFQLDSDRLALLDLDAAVVKRSAELGVPLDQKPMIANLKSLLSERRNLIKGLDADYSRFFQQLVEMDNLERRLLNLTTKYADYVDERVLWIRTGQAFSQDNLLKASKSLAWLSDRSSWNSVGDAAKMNIIRLPFWWAISAVSFVVWLALRPILKKLVHHRGLAASHRECRNLTPTLQTLSLTLIIASGWPLLLWFVGWRIDHSASTITFVHAVAAGMLRAALFALPLEVLRIACLSGGLAEHHFNWPKSTINRWRRNLSWYLPVGLMLVGLIALTEGVADEHRLDSIGRLTFLVFAAMTALFCYLTIRRPLKPLDPNEAATEETAIQGATAHGVTAEATEASLKATAEADAWSDRFWRFCPRLAVGTGLLLFALDWSGFFYTALQLNWRLQNTTWLLVSLMLVRATVRRWIALEKRRMAVLQDQELQTITEAGFEPGNSGYNQFLLPRWTWPDFRMNLTQIVSQMRRLLDTGLIAFAVAGLWLVWADVTPALNILDRVVLWHTTVEQVEMTDETTHISAAATEKHLVIGQTVKRQLPVTAADLGMAMLIMAMAVIAGRNIPGLVEVILHEHLSVDAGVRFAATCLVRYAIFVAGVGFAFAQIRVGWNNVQWLVAAASVGLGFGLQEIFANFVSGIILLFERPMRVGDVVTVGDTTGTVSRIRFRATTIVDGDRKELIVPNKEFITGKLLNWTLSDRVNRFAVKVMVGSNNDPQRIRRLLLEIAALQPTLLKDPAPTASLEELSGGQTFVVRAFLPSLDGRANAINDLYMMIHKRFEAEGIEMPRPSQEVFLRTDVQDAHSSSPPAPHQPMTTAAIKKW